MSILPGETELKGSWIWVDGKFVADNVSRRIQDLVDKELKLVSVSRDGWTKIFEDPQDGRLWELSFPQGEMHGGGPPKLQVVKS